MDEKYKLWYEVWAIEYLPLLINRPKWSQPMPNLEHGDVVLIKIKDSPMHADWRLGEIVEALGGKDGLVRNVKIKYSVKPEQEEAEIDLIKTWRTNIVTRPVRQCVKLFHIEETSLVSDIKEALSTVKKIINS